MAKSDLYEYFQTILTNEKRRQMRHGVNAEVSKNEAIRTGIHRVPGHSETNEVAVQPLHHYVFCSHNVPYWRVCTKCGRDKALAAKNASMIFAKAQTMKTSA